MVKIKELRTEYGMNQKELAKKLGISAGNLCDWEKSRTQPDIERLKQIAGLFNVSVDYLVGYDPDNLALNPSITAEEINIIASLRSLPTDTKDLIKGLVLKIADRKLQISSDDEIK